MQRCIQLAKLGAGNTAPNPMVGAVLVYDDKVIGEGYHQQYGKAHAEVNCINSVHQNSKYQIPDSTLYVSLEPCSHFGKTPPCSDLIIQQQIKKVVIGCSDSFKEVNGRGIEKLKAAGIEVITNVLEQECRQLNKRFFTFHEKQRPFVVLKWAETLDKKMGSNNNTRMLISNSYSNRLVHKWRSEEAAILVGPHTALLDNPSLNNRLWYGNNPVRLVIDKQLQLPPTLTIFNGQQQTIVFNFLKHETEGSTMFYQLNGQEDFLQQLLHACYQLNLQSILVEGGAKLLQSFIDKKLWDEARIITNTTLIADNGVNAPIFAGKLTGHQQISTDNIKYYLPLND